MARALNKETLLANRRFVEKCKTLYGSLDGAAERYSALTENFEKKPRFFSASGRAEFIGNHTDHNHGYVIASAIDMDVAAAVIPTDGNTVTVESIGYPAFTVSVDDDTIVKEEFGTSKAIVKGVIQGFKQSGRKVGGFFARMHSTVCKGAGVSSSASFELVVCEILNALYNGGEMDYAEMAVISQFAENIYFGKPSGLMDQLSASHGGISFMDFEDPQNPKAKNLYWQFDDELVIINCGGDHCDLTDEYAAIKSDMTAIAKHFNKNFLREVDEKEFFNKIPELKDKFSGRAILRAVHFFEENERVLKCYDALNRGDREKFFSLIDESGVSSYELLQNCYPNGSVEQPIPLALAILKRDPRTLACRVHGGGFAGTVLAFVNKKDADGYVKTMDGIFGKENVFLVSVRNEGATEIPTEE